MQALIRLAAIVFALIVGVCPATIAVAQKRTVTCSGILIEVDMIAGAAFPMAVVYDNTDELTRVHACSTLAERDTGP
jgi:hypothetical protein